MYTHFTRGCAVVVLSCMPRFLLVGWDVQKDLVTEKKHFSDAKTAREIPRCSKDFQSEICRIIWLPTKGVPQGRTYRKYSPSNTPPQVSSSRPSAPASSPPSTRTPPLHPYTHTSPTSRRLEPPPRPPSHQYPLSRPIRVHKPLQPQDTAS
jgi:hypothetical protein